MEQNALTALLQLGVVIVIAVGAVLLLLRFSGRAITYHSGIVQGYPPGLFPAQELTGAGALAALAETQARLLSIYEQVPAQSDLAVWLHAFLRELREIMDTAYRVAVITHVYGRPAQLDRLVEEVRQIEAQFAEHAVQRLLARDGDTQQVWLDGRMATLRMCVRELASLAEG